MDEPDLHCWTPELRRAVMAVRPDFFGWFAGDRLSYRVKPPDTDREAIVAALLRAHGRRRPVATAKLESRGRIDLVLQNEINEWLQPLGGIGEDSFSLNESFADGCSILDFPTLLAYDQDDHAFQRQARQAEDPKTARRPYAGTLHATWARCMLDGRLCYLTLSMAAWYCYGSMQTAASDEIARLVPHRYVPGPQHGRREGGLIRWDHRVDAGRREGMLDELQRRAWAYEARRCEALLAQFKEQRQAGTFFIADPYPDEPHDERNLLIVFSDPEALARVRFTSFMRDSRALERPREELQAVEAAEVGKVVHHVQEEYDDLLRNFDPKVVPLRKRREVMLHPDAVRDLGDRGES